MAKSGLASRLYRGEADLNIVGRRKLWFGVAAVLVLVAVLSFAVRGFSLGIEFAGGNSFQVPASVGTLDGAEAQVNAALKAEGGGAEVVTAQKVGGAGGDFYEMRTTQLSPEQANAVKGEIAKSFHIDPSQISGDQVSQAWGAQVTERALLGLLIFIAVVAIYLILRFEWRMAVSAIASLFMNLALTAGIYSLVGFEVTPSTIIGFLTILGFALYDVVVVFDKVQENTRGITANNNLTYGEAANLALNQSLMRSLNTSVVALLPVGGLLFIGAGLLGAGQPGAVTAAWELDGGRGKAIRQGATGSARQPWVHIARSAGVTEQDQWRE
jgi:preprotein translocase subunit SecF